MYEIIGTITKLETKANPANFYRTNVTKMTIADKDGSRYCGTRPAGLVDAEVGDKVRLTAEIGGEPRDNGKRYFYDATRGVVV